jgi:hypothetical protein
MAVRTGHATTRSARYALGPGADLPIARVVAIALILLALAAVWFAVNAAFSAPSPAASQIANIDPSSVLGDTTPDFLPTPVAALPPAANAGPPAPAAAEDTAADTSTERVKVANTGGVGAILRADPPSGKQVGALRDGTLLDVMEHRTLADGSEWLHVKTQDGTAGWVYSRLVAISD